MKKKYKFGDKVYHPGHKENGLIIKVSQIKNYSDDKDLTQLYDVAFKNGEWVECGYDDISDGREWHNDE